MAYCEYCGGLIPEGAGYCSNCGAPAPVTSSSVSSSSAASTADPVMQQGTGDYFLILVSLGTCAKAAASDLLEDVLGYTPEQASDLFEMLPAQAAQQLTHEQALYLAKAMTEYGMEVSVRNGSGYISIDDIDDNDDEETESVFDSAGSFLKKAAAVLGMITGMNRMRKFRKLEERRFYEKPFRRTPSPAPQPVHVRRNLRTAPEMPQRHYHSMQPEAGHHDIPRQQGSFRQDLHHEPGRESFGPGKNSQPQRNSHRGTGSSHGMHGPGRRP